MLNPSPLVKPGRAQLPRALARAVSLIPLALVAVETADAFAQSPVAAAPASGQTPSPAAPAATPADFGAPAPPTQPTPVTASPPATAPYYPAPYYPAPYYPAPPPGYPTPRPYPTTPPAPRPKPTFWVGSLALGLGTPYGLMGGGGTFGFDYVSVIAGVGSALFEGLGWGAGLRVHVLDTSHYWRPHFTAVYGTTCVYKIAGAFGPGGWTGVLRGFGFYLGIDQDFGEPGSWFATYGIGYITHEDVPAYVKDAIGGSPGTGRQIDILVAFGYRFGGK